MKVYMKEVQLEGFNWWQLGKWKNKQKFQLRN